MRDEMALRERLRDYEGFNEDGTPVLEPWQVPPIVSQHLPYLRPTARTKMFNAVVDQMGDAGKLKDYYGLPARAERREKAANFDLLAPLLRCAEEPRTFTTSRTKRESGISSFTALTGIVSARSFLEVFKSPSWNQGYESKIITPTLRFYEAPVENGALEDVVIVWPTLTRAVETRSLPGLGKRQVIKRSRRSPPRIDFAGSNAKHRDSLERIAGAAKTTEDGEADALRRRTGRRAAMLVYVAAAIADSTSASDPTALPQDPREQRPRRADLTRGARSGHSARTVGHRMDRPPKRVMGVGRDQRRLRYSRSVAPTGLLEHVRGRRHSRGCLGRRFVFPDA